MSDTSKPKLKPSINPGAGPGGSITSSGSVPFLLPDKKAIQKLNKDLGIGLTDKQINALANDVKTLNGKLVVETMNGPADVATASMFTRAFLGLPVGLQSFLSRAWSLPSPGATDWSKAAQSVVSQTQGNAGDSSLVSGAQVTDITNQVVTNAQANALATSQATASAQVNAFDNIQNYLEQWNLGGLTNKVKQLITQQGNYLTNQNALLDWVRQQPEYKKAFPGLTEHNDPRNLSNMSEHMTEAQYQNYVQTINGLAGQYAFPAGFITPGQIGNWVKNNVSAAELEQRMKYGYTAALNADANTKAILQQQYGLTTGQLAAYMLDPSHALQTIEKQVASATLQGYAKDVGLKGITQQQGEQLANMVNVGAGSIGSGDITTRMSGVQSALLQASRDQPLTAKAPGTAGTTIDTNQLIGAQLAGFTPESQAADQAAVQRAEQSRVAGFQQGGGFEENQKGVIGVGSARI